MTEEERIFRGELFASEEPELVEKKRRAHRLSQKYNETFEDDAEVREAILRELLGELGEGVCMLGPVRFHYGCHTRVGNHCFMNFNFTVQDDALVTIGDHCNFGPNVTIVTPMHPMLPDERRGMVCDDGVERFLCYAKPVTIGHDCWFGANVVVCPGVTIREDALLDMLADMLQDALDTALGQYTLSLAELPRQAADRAELREKITSRRQEVQRLRGIVRSLYENLVQGVLTKDEYFDYKEKYESRIADLAVEMEQLEDGLRTMDAQTEQHRALEQDAAQIKTDRALTGALIERLIDRIEVSHDKQITVRYRFQSEFETYAEVLEQCRNM